MMFIRWTLITMVIFIAGFTLADHLLESVEPWSTQRYPQLAVVGGSFLAGFLCWIATRFRPTDDRYDE